jgi:hypothetical protein
LDERGRGEPSIDERLLPKTRSEEKLAETWLISSRESSFHHRIKHMLIIPYLLYKKERKIALQHPN